ncbi:hypothetical protein TNCV_4144991 [Trichonephila clavipes]|nr:hypothetical protein TNCV_4144991 [Trichonephila clavipes]
MPLEQTWAVKLRVIRTVMIINEVRLSNPTLGPEFSRTHNFPSSNLFLINYAKLQAVHGSTIVNNELSQSTAPFLETINPIPTLKTKCGNHGKGLASMQKRVDNGGRREGVWDKTLSNSKCKQTQCILHSSCL